MIRERRVNISASRASGMMAPDAAAEAVALASELRGVRARGVRELLRVVREPLRGRRAATRRFLAILN